MYEKRIAAVQKRLQAENLDGYLCCDPYSVKYLTGAFTHPGERFFGVYISLKRGAVLILNKLFAVVSKNFPDVTITDTDDLPATIAEIIGDDRAVGVDKFLKARELLPLIERFSEISFSLSSAVDSTRAVKDSYEIEQMIESSRINDICMARTAKLLKAGVSEREVAEQLKKYYAEEGAEALAFPPMVAFGKNAADPHHQTGDTIAKDGDCAVLDIGCTKNGYHSDMTRTFFIGEPSERHREIYNIVREANEKAIKAVKAGTPLCLLDKIARDHITEHGYGEYFTHRLGHFIGTECHEAGDVSAANKNETVVGNIFSIEPGIYIKGEIGVRIEDLIVVTENGYLNLNSHSKEI